MTPGVGERRFGKNLLLRVIVAFIFVPLFLWVSYKGGLPFLFYVELLIYFGIREYFNLVESKGHVVYRATGTGFALAWGVLFYYSPDLVRDIATLLVFLFTLICLVGWLLSRDYGLSLEGIGLSMLGVYYVGFLFSHQILLREADFSSGGNGVWSWYYILFPYIIVWTSDTAAYFVGKYIGRHPLSPKISPGKSIEGAVGGFLFAVIVAFIYQSLVQEPISRLDALILGGLVAIVCQVGDMIESRLKREVGVKDSSSLIPGHGGILDRYDGILLAVPVSYYYFAWISPMLLR